MSCAVAAAWGVIVVQLGTTWWSFPLLFAAGVAGIFLGGLIVAVWTWDSRN